MKVGDLVEHKLFKRLGFGIIMDISPIHVNVLWAGRSKQATETLSLVRLASESS